MRVPHWAPFQCVYPIASASYCRPSPYLLGLTRLPQDPTGFVVGSVSLLPLRQTAAISFVARMSCVGSPRTSKRSAFFPTSMTPRSTSLHLLALTLVADASASIADLLLSPLNAISLGKSSSLHTIPHFDQDKSIQLLHDVYFHIHTDAHA